MSVREAASILHVDMDAFFVSVELRRRPELRGVPVVVGGPGARGVVAAASYEARAYGVHSAMPSTRARRLCPQAVFLAGDHAHYAEVSRAVMEVFHAFTPLVEPISLDEAFLDVGGARRLHGTGEVIAHRIRDEVTRREDLTCSVGVSAVKFVAKLASEAAKPKASTTGPRPGRGVVVVEPGQEQAFLHPLPVRALWGVGPATLAKLERLGVATIGDLAALPVDAVVGVLGRAAGHHLSALAHAVDEREVVPDQRPKSIGHEETFPSDHRRHDTLQVELVRMADAVATRLRRANVAGRTVTIKVRFHDFRTITRSSTLPTPVDSGTTIARVARELLAGVDPSAGVRLLGVSVSQLDSGAVRQLTFDDNDDGDGGAGRDGGDAAGWRDAELAMDAVRAKFGDTSLGPASLAGPGGLRVKRPGAQQWGPGSGPPHGS